jgi:hypothetical protein
MGLRHAGTIDDAGRHHAGQTESTLECKRHENIDRDAQQAGIEDGLVGIGRGILELARVADGGLKSALQSAKEPRSQTPGTTCRRLQLAATTA